MCPKKKDLTTPRRLRQLLAESSENFQQEKHERSIELAEAALVLARRLKVRSPEAIALDLRGQASSALGRRNQAIEDCREALHIYKETGNGRLTATAHQNLGARLLEAGRLHEAEEQNILGIDECVKLEQWRERAHITRNLGLTYSRMDDTAAAVLHLGRAASLFRSQGLSSNEADALLDLAEVYARQMQIPQAEDCARKAQSLIDFGLPTPALARSCAVQASIFRAKNEWAKARFLTHQAETYYEEMGDNKNVRYQRLALVDIYWNQGRDAEALESLIQISSSFENEQPKPSIDDFVHIYFSLGRVYDRLGRLHEAEMSLRRALAYAEEENRPDLQAKVLHQLGHILAKLEKWPEAKKLLRDARKSFQQQGRNLDAAYVLQSMGSYHYLRGNTWRSVGVFKEAQKEFRNLDSSEGQARVLTALASLQGTYSPLTSIATLASAGENYGVLHQHQASAWAATCQAKDWLQFATEPFPRFLRPRFVRQQLVEQALDLAVPAAVYLDGIKFQFSGTTERIRSGVRSREAWNTALELARAQDNAQLLTEIVEVIINGASYTQNDEVEGGVSEEDPHLPDELEVGTENPVLATVAAGTTRLLSTAQLPAGPGPLLLLPTTREIRYALQAWAGVSRYPAVPRPSAPVRTW
jgi:tetratricopeptide (TPR) repeat protein